MTVCKQRAKSDHFVILAAHVISPAHQRSADSLPGPGPLQIDRDSLLAEKQRSDFQLTEPIVTGGKK